MVVVPLPQPENEFAPVPRGRKAEPLNWVRIAASGSLVAGGLLLLNGRRRAGLAVAASGTALAMLDQQELLRAWWNALPGYIDELQGLLGQVQSTVEELTAQCERLHRILSR
ncbi:MAG: hypothetical protein ABSA48_10165 [Terracidiphilus sp.]|jgi:hypothetical protein